jgi:hypothetical protein
MVCARTERLSVPVIYLDIHAWFHSDLASRDLTVPSIGKERVSTVAKPELKVAVKIYGNF